MKPKRLLPPRKRWRAFFGLFLSPWVTAAGLVLMVFALNAAFSGSQIPAQSLGSMLLAFGAGLLVLNFSFGWIFHAIAFRRRWRGMVTYVKAGASAGALAALLVVGAIFIAGRAGAEIGAALLGAGVGSIFFFILPGGLTAWVFWLIRRPDRDTEPAPHDVFD